MTEEYQNWRETAAELCAVLENKFRDGVELSEMRERLLNSLEAIDALTQSVHVDSGTASKLTPKVEEKIAAAKEQRNIELLNEHVGETFLEIYNAEKNNKGPKNVTTKARKALKKKFVAQGGANGNNGGDDDDDIIAEQAVIRQRDPITKERITVPVRNKHCGHVYNKHTIIEFIVQERNARRLCQCPQPGCQNKKQLIEVDIEEYEEYFQECELER